MASDDSGDPVLGNLRSFERNGLREFSTWVGQIVQKTSEVRVVWNID